ncbi:MAG TPA: 3-deoxy-D-manno-octulosonate 8-phosphate phosphatase [Elusimicrobia bacterium]|nr:3-deoxy-D-manno-octulosonate 8-phosphate phosphatase [Elusimicrobiota bacterium]HBT60827.1 3-deoxy-D-manno-octulosonate 8-phosphate phosphatase [Elusimicrobiota bacterium]
MPQLTSRALRDRLRRVRIVLMDVDGVLTSGHIYHFVDTSGELVEFKGIHAQDSIALNWLAQMGLKTGVISGRISKGVAERMKILEMTYVYQHRLDKKAVVAEICRDARSSPQEVLYIGDDVPDIPVLRIAGVAVAVRNARPETRRAAHWVTRRSGGDGAVREVAETLLKTQGLWPRVLEKFR